MQHSYIGRARFWLLLLVVLSLSACGFKLRGPVNFPFASIYVKVADGSALGGELRRQIRANGTTIISRNEDEAEVVLESLGERREKQILSLNSQGLVREYNLIYGFRFRVRSPQGKEYLAPVNIELKRTITFNESVVLAKEAEEALLYRDMQTDLIQQIMRRLAVLKVEE